MKIVNRVTFLSLPENTLFAKYDSRNGFGPIEIKGNGPDEWQPDYISQDLMHPYAESSDDMTDLLERVEQTGESFRLSFDSYGRDGLYEDEQLFAVFELTDLMGMYDAIAECIHSAIKLGK